MSNDMQCRAIILVDDDDVEGEETFNVFLQNPSSNGLLDMPNNAVVTITDNGIQCSHV